MCTYITYVRFDGRDTMFMFESNEGTDHHNRDHTDPAVEDQDAEGRVMWRLVQERWMDLYRLPFTYYNQHQTSYVIG